jgi:hypothetical protein
MSHADTMDDIDHGREMKGRIQRQAFVIQILQNNGNRFRSIDGKLQDIHTHRHSIRTIDQHRRRTRAISSRDTMAGGVFTTATVVIIVVVVVVVVVDGCKQLLKYGSLPHDEFV